MSSNKLTVEENLYWERWKKERDPEAGNFLIKNYQSLVEYVIQRLMIGMPKSVDKDEIRSLAYEGLVDAIDKFAIEKETKFETYAMWRIKGAVMDGLRKRDWLPRSVRQKVKKLEEAYAVLEQKNNRSVTDEEVCQYLGITKAELNRTVSESFLVSTVSLDEITHDEDDEQVSRFNTIPNHQAVSPEKYLTEKLLKETLTNAIERLPDKEKLVVSLLYFEELKLREIAEVLDVSISRVSQLHSKAMARLNAAIHSIHENY